MANVECQPLNSQHAAAANFSVDFVRQEAASSAPTALYTDGLPRVRHLEHALNTDTSAYFGNARILAPMVRVCSLPFRLLALAHGADIVYTPETIDRKIIGSRRQYNPLLGTFDYVKDDKVFLRCHPAEKPRLGLQLGTADPELALKAALAVSKDVSFVDVNCGCPKSFSIQGGMGAALLSDPDRLCAILRNLVLNSGVQVTAKIRVFKDKARTLKLVDQIIDTGIAALAVHARTKEERPQDKADWDMWRVIGDHVNGRVPLIANGDVFGHNEINSAMNIKGVDAVMLARGARSNPSVFSKTPLTTYESMLEYIRYSIRWNLGYKGIKYLVQIMLEHTDEETTRKIHTSKCTRDIALIWGLESYYDDIQASFMKAVAKLPPWEAVEALKPEYM